MGKMKISKNSYTKKEFVILALYSYICFINSSEANHGITNGSTMIINNHSQGLSRPISARDELYGCFEDNIKKAMEENLDENKIVYFQQAIYGLLFFREYKKGNVFIPFERIRDFIFMGNSVNNKSNDAAKGILQKLEVKNSNVETYT